jgi:hypothetical protein
MLEIYIFPDEEFLNAHVGWTDTEAMSGIKIQRDVSSVNGTVIIYQDC